MPCYGTRPQKTDWVTLLSAVLTFWISFGNRTLKTYRTVRMYSLPDIMTRKESERYIPSLKAFRLHLSDLWNTKPTTTVINPMIKSSYLTGTTKRTANCTSVNSSVNTFSTLRKTRASRFTTTENIRLCLNRCSDCGILPWASDLWM